MEKDKNQEIRPQILGGAQFPDSDKSHLDFIVQHGKDKKNIKLHTYNYDAQQFPPKAVLFVYHGLSQHLGNSAAFAKYMSQNGIQVAGFDHRGFGKSEGTPGLVENFDQHILDSEQHMKIYKENFYKKNKNLQKLPTFLLGESMGGLTAFRLALKSPEEYNGIIMLNPAISGTFSTKYFGWVIGGISQIGLGQSRILPRVWGKSYKDQSVEQWVRYHDPYFRRQANLPQTLWNLIKNMNNAPKEYKNLLAPCMLIQGGKDAVVNNKQHIEFEKNCGSKDKTIIYKDNLWHGCFLEEEMKDLQVEINDWIDLRIKKN